MRTGAANSVCSIKMGYVSDANCVDLLGAAEECAADENTRSVAVQPRRPIREERPGKLIDCKETKTLRAMNTAPRSAPMISIRRCESGGALTEARNMPATNRAMFENR